MWQRERLVCQIQALLQPVSQPTNQSVNPISLTRAVATNVAFDDDVARPAVHVSQEVGACRCTREGWGDQDQAARPNMRKRRRAGLRTSTHRGRTTGP